VALKTGIESSSKDQRRPSWRQCAAGAVLVAALGLVFHGTQLGEAWDQQSYDWLFLFTAKPAPPGLVLIKMDELAHRELKQPRGAWDRGLHARLVDKLRADGARLVVFDVFFTEPGDPTTNARFAKAMAAHGKVILSGDMEPIKEPGFTGMQPLPPLEPFVNASAGWGLANLNRDPDGTVRRQFPGGDLNPGLAWAAASALDAPVTREDRMSFFRRGRWLRYYDEGSTLTNSYHRALAREPGYFTNKVVFIGGEPRTRFSGEEADEFRTPFTRRAGFVAGVDVQATAFLNLLHHDWLTRLPRAAELLLLGIVGAAFAIGLSFIPIRFGIPMAVAGMIGIAIASLLVALHGQYWFGWLTAAGFQIPAACAWVIGLRSFQKSARPVAPTGDAVPTVLDPNPPGFGGVSIPLRITPPGADNPPPDSTLNISGHALIRCIGRGAYGEVWLARDVIGSFHAVKVIHRRNFPNSTPFDREFRGIQKFTPISRSHPGFVHILHVERDDNAGRFYYIMEAGDDAESGQQIDPATYVPKNLSRELDRRQRLPVHECLSLFIALASALEHLHRHQLIHRDIKPSNIIFVNGAPKLADIGLVTDLGRQGRDVTYIGTEGYLAPEGPGTPAADVFSLGKVIYEAAMGRSRDRFPELPTTLIENPPANGALLELNDIIVRACAPDVSERYRTAAELQADLLRLQERLQTVQP
jgi:CHASE2 domain-containing sensor protein